MTEARTVLDEIGTERQRQIDAEGWTRQHDDDEHYNGELPRAAAAYALRASGMYAPDPRPPAMWPWEDESWKPSNARRMLVKAGALIVAEIERIDRKAAND